MSADDHPQPAVIGFSETTIFAAEGARAGLTICDTCGAAILLDPRDGVDRMQQHADWHSTLATVPKPIPRTA